MFLEKEVASLRTKHSALKHRYRALEKELREKDIALVGKEEQVRLLMVERDGLCREIHGLRVRASGARG